VLDISVSSPSLQQSNLVAAREDFFAARYSSCIEACSAAIENESENSKEALILRARALLRMSKPSDVIASISRELSAFTDSNGKLEAQIQLATAHALVGDFASASSYIADLVSQVEATTPSTLRSEIAYTSAFVAWARGDLIEAEKLLVEKAGESSWSRARRVILKSWIASKRQNFEEHTRLLLEGCNTLQTTGPLDVGSLAPAVRAVCNMAREIPRAGLQAEAQALYDSIPWTDELGADNFMSCRALGWGLSLEGESRYFESLRLLHKATSLAPSQAWKVWALLDRAARKRYAGELGASSADLFEAVQICDQVDWANTIDEERLGLLYAAELCAAVDLIVASIGDNRVPHTP